MAQYRTTIPSRKSPEEAVAYLAEFTSAATWDPSVVEARRLGGNGPVQVGASFLIVSRFAGRDVALEYEVIDLVPGQRVVLRAETERLVGTDTVTVEPDGEGSLVTYDAELRPQGLARMLDPLLALVFRRMAGRAAAGLQDALSR